MNTQKCKALILLLIVLLSLFHFGLAAYGYKFYDQYPPKIKGVNYQYQLFFPIFLFIVIAASFEFFVTFVLMVQIYNNYGSSYVRYVLASFDLVLTFSLSVVIALLASNIDIYRGSPQIIGQGGGDDFQTLYQLCIADAVMTFGIEFMYLVVLYFSTLEDYEHDNKIVKKIKIREVKITKKDIRAQKQRIRYTHRKL